MSPAMYGSVFRKVGQHYGLKRGHCTDDVVRTWIRNRVDVRRSGHALPRDLPDWRSGTKPFASWTKKPLLLFRRSALLLFRLKHLQHRRPAKPPLLPLSRLPQQRPPRHLLRTSPFYAKNQTARAAKAGSENKIAQAAENDFHQG